MDRQPPRDDAATRIAYIVVAVLIGISIAWIRFWPPQNPQAESGAVDTRTVGETELPKPQVHFESPATTSEPQPETGTPSSDSNINELANKTHSTPEQIERGIGVTRELMAKEGVYENDADIARHMNEMLPAGEKYDAAQAAAVYAGGAIAEHQGHGLR